MSLIRLQNLGKRFEGKPALKSISLEIASGEFLVLVGPSGCGKSTLLRLLAGLESASEGHIWLEGEDVTATSPRERNFAMIFQNYALFPHLTVKDNITFGMRIRREPKATRQARLEEAVRLLQLEAVLDRKPGRLSGGQRQRVAMARAIVRHPRLFLMDEPLSNLDARLRTDVRDGIMALHRQLKTTTVYVTHDQIEAMTMADRIAVMDRGELQQIGTPEQLYAYPANVFVAGFIGSPAMNLVRISCRNGSVMLDEDTLTLPTHAAHIPEIVFGVRPEHLTDQPEPGIHTFQLAGRVTQRELLGGEYLLHVETAIGMLRYCRKNRGDVPERGDPVRLGIESTDIHLFNAATGHNLFQEIPHA